MQRDPRFEPDMPTPTEAGFTMELDINETPVEADVTFCYIEVDGKAVVETSEIEIESYISSDMTKWLPQVQDAIDNFLFPKEVIYK